MVERAQVDLSARLESNRGLVAGWWRWAAVALAALAAILLAGIGAAIRRLRRQAEGPLDRRAPPPAVVASANGHRRRAARRS